MTSLTSLARPLDLARPSNRLPVLAAAVFLIGGTFAELALSGATTVDALWSGARYGAAAFLVWAVGRELDPDRPRAARYGVFAYVALAWLGEPALLSTAAVLVAARLLLRPVGHPPTPVDLGAVVVLAAWAAAADPTGLITALALAAALAGDVRLAGDPRTEQTAAAGIAAVAAIVLAGINGTLLTTWKLPAVPGLLAAAATAVAAIRVLGPVAVSSTADAARHTLSEDRLRWARTLVVAAAVVTLLWTGAAAVAGVAPVLAAVIGAGITGLRGGSGGGPRRARADGRRRPPRARWS